MMKPFRKSWFFFFVTLIAWGALGTAPLEAQTASKVTDWKVGVSVGGFRDKTPDAAELASIKKAGFDAIEFSLSAAGVAWPEEKRLDHFRKFKNDCDAAGLDLWSVHVPFSQTLDISLTDDTKRQTMIDLVVWLLDANKTLSAKVFVIHPSSEPIADDDRPARKARAIESLKFLNAEAKKRGIRLAVEDLPRTCLLRNAEEANEILGAVGNGISLVFDSNHLLTEKPEEFLARLDPSINIATTHFSDYDAVDERHWAPYEGVISWKAVIAELEKRGYPGPFVFEGAGRPDKSRLSYPELFERWTEVRDEATTGFPPARALWPTKTILASKPAWEKAGDTAGLVTPLYYDSIPFQGKPTKVFAYLGKPEGEGPFPAILLVHGGGGKAFSEWADHWAKRGYVALAMDLGGCGPEGKPQENGGPDQSDVTKFRPFSANDYVDRWTYHAIAAILNGHALLKSFPVVDSEKIAETGISWGGYLTSILSGVDPEIKAFVPVYGCGFLHEDSCWKESGIFAKMTPEQTALWVKLFDPSSHLARATAPILWVNGTNDFAYPLDSYQKCYRLPKGKRTLAIALNRPHGHIWTFPEVDAFIDATLGVGNAKPLQTVGATKLDGDKATAPFSGEKPVKAEFFWTSDTGRWQEKKWQIVPATVLDDRVESPVPAEARSFFFNLTDDRGLTVSSEHLER